MKTAPVAKRKKVSEMNLMDHMDDFSGTMPVVHFVCLVHPVHKISNGDVNHFYKYSAFFEKRRGVRGEEKNFFSREKKFFSFPRLPSTLIRNSVEILIFAL